MTLKSDRLIPTSIELSDGVVDALIALVEAQGDVHSENHFEPDGKILAGADCTHPDCQAAHVVLQWLFELGVKPR